MAADGDVTVEELSADVAAVVGTGVPGAVGAAADDGGATAEVGAIETDAPLAVPADPADGDDDDTAPGQHGRRERQREHGRSSRRRADGHRCGLAGSSFTVASR